MAAPLDLEGALYQLVDMLDESAVLIDTDGVILAINRTAAGRLDGTRESLIGRVAYDLLPPEVAAFRRGVIDEAIATGREIWFSDQRSGRVFENRVSPLTDDSGAVARVAVFAQDVTDRCMADRRQQEAAEELETIQDHVPVAMILLDADRRVTRANDAAVRMSGTPRSELLRQVGGAALHCLNSLDDERGCGYGPSCGECHLRQTVAAAMDKGEPVEGLDVSLPLAGPDGPETRRLLVSVAPVAIRGERQVLVCLQDFTDIRETEADRDLKAMVLDQIEDRVTVTDLEGNILYVNDAECRSLGRTRDQLVGANVTVYGDDPDRGATQREIIETTRRAGAWRGEIINYTAEGDEVEVECRTWLVHDEHGEPVAMAGIATDVSERRRLESQLRQVQKMDALGRLAAGVAHDFNNQITVIKGYADVMLAQAGESSPLRQHALEIRRAAERSSATTSHLLTFSRQRDLAPARVDLNSLVDDLYHPVSKMIGETIRVHVEASPRLHPVMVDRPTMQQAVLNLLINARDAMPDGGDLVIRTANVGAAEPGGRPEAMVEIIDSGHGIDPAHLDRIFEPFFTTKGEGEGTGLGLSMVRGFAEQSGGRVTVRSTPGAGTAVAIVLPAAVDAGAVAEKKDAAETADTGSSLAGTVLVVEDSEAVRRVVAEILGRRGLDVSVAALPGEAVAMAERAGAPYDLLLTDVVMPDMSGDDLATLLTSRGHVRNVAYMTGYADRGARIGLAPLLLKPFDAGQLVAIVESALVGPEAAGRGAERNRP
jgi:PAS domain S-box-containing protein